MWSFFRSFKIVDYVLLLWIILWVAPQSALLPFYNLTWLTCYAFWFVVVIKNLKFFSSKEQNAFVLYVICFSIIILESLLVGKTDLMHNMVEHSQMPFIFFLFCYYRRCRDWTTLKNMVIVSIPIFFVFSITTITTLLVNPYAARIVYVSGDKMADSQQYLMAGVGGYNFIYATLLLAIVLFYVFFSVKLSRAVRVLCVSLFCVFSVLIILSNFFTAFVLLLVSPALLLLSRKRKLIAPFVIVALMIAPIYKVVGIAAIDGISYFLSEEGRTYERLQGIRYSFETGTKVDEDVDTRSGVKKMSKETFFEHPILGAVVGTDLTENAIGNHSTFWDALARFGIVVGGLLISLFLLPFIRLFSESHTYRNKDYVFCYGATVFFLMINNNFPIAGAFVSYFVFPCSFLLLKEKVIKNT